MQQLVNGVYNRRGAIGKRTGSGKDIGAGTVGTGAAVKSGVRWHRAIYANAPNPLSKMVVQSNDILWARDDGTGNYINIGALTMNSTPAFYASAFDTTANSDTLVIAYGSGPPVKWDGNALSALDASITQHFTGVEAYHDHLVFWGDANNPDTIILTDLANIHSTAFSSAFGGYQIARGDGDPTVQRCIKSGSSLFIFKTNSIKVMSGYDFQSGEYQFNLQPFADGIGIPSPNCVAAFPDGTIIFWSGQNFYLITPGASAPVPIGSDIMNEIASAASRNQSVVRAVAGDFVVQTVAGPTVYTDVALFAVDDGTGAAARVLMLDYGMTREAGAPYWTVFTGLSIGCFIPWQGAGDQRRLYFGSPTTDTVLQFGQNALNDNGAAIPFMLQLNRDDMDTPDQYKSLDKIFLETEAGGATFTLSIMAESNQVASSNFVTTNPQGGSLGVFGSGIFGTSTFGSGTATAYQAPFASFADIRGRNFSVTINESSATSAYELVGMTVHLKEDAYPT